MAIAGFLGIEEKSRYRRVPAICMVNNKRLAIIYVYIHVNVGLPVIYLHVFCHPAGRQPLTRAVARVDEIYKLGIKMCSLTFSV